MASTRRVLPVATLALRVLALIFLVVSFAIITTVKIRVEDPLLDEQEQITFEDFYAYR
jgi:hypothetical protein